MEAVYQLAEWLEEDLPARFAEVLDDVLGRLPNEQTEEKENE